MALQALDNKEVEIITERFEKTFRHWMENLRDWPISRQIWWGISIPVWYCQAMQNEDCRMKNGIIVSADEKPNKCPYCQSTNLIQDPDTFDTWFSSGQWPYATLMANDVKREQSANKQISRSDINQFFPTEVMETGWDILFFWVARMVMLSYYKTNKPPFKKVFLHGLVRDKDRQKMSKSKGNVIDPLGIIDTYGTDALRFALIFSTSAGNDIPLAEDKIKGMKHFGNKLWNISRFILTNESTNSKTQDPSTKPEGITEADKDILGKLETLVKSATNNLENFRLHEAAQEIYQFVWHEFADKYIETSKQQLADEKLKESTYYLLLTTLTASLKLLHPFMPFVTEHIWQLLKDRGLVKNNLLMIEKWPA
jgi:valyl-tRNA synthetase